MEFRIRLLITYLVYLLSHATPSLASGCVVPPCGRVVNKTRWHLRWADFGRSDDRCDVYNWKDGKGSVGWSEKRVGCKQYWLSEQSSKGGFAHDSIDVDGITFDDRRWRIIWEHGQSYDFKEGVWAKIGSGETITCTENKEVPECRVKCDTDFLNACIGD